VLHCGYYWIILWVNLLGYTMEFIGIKCGIYAVNVIAEGLLTVLYTSVSIIYVVNRLKT